MRKNIPKKAGDRVLRSMTGYGRAQQILNGRDILVEIRSVNHRYYEYSSRVPRTYSYIDEKLKALLKNGISRGKVEVSVTINNIEGKDTEIAINKGAAEGYVNALRSIADELGVEDDITLSKLMKLPDIFNVVYSFVYHLAPSSIMLVSLLIYSRISFSIPLIRSCTAPTLPISCA